MNISMKLLSGILEILKIQKFLKNNQQQKLLFSKNCWIFFEFSKNGKYVKEPYQVYMCTKFHVDILENDRGLVF